MRDVFGATWHFFAKQNKHVAKKHPEEIKKGIKYSKYLIPVLYSKMSL